MIRITDATGKVFEAKAPLTIAEVPDAPPVVTTYSITVNPTTMQAGNNVTVTCRFEGVGGAWLKRNGAGEQALNGPVATIVEKPSVTTKYTLKVLVGNEYKEADATVTVTPAPQTTWRRGVGVHTMYGRDAAAAAFRLGCRDFTVLNDWDTAVWLCDQMGKTSAFDGKGMVLFREYISNWPSFDQVMGYMRKGWDKRVVRIITNESEFLPGGNSVEGILRHAELDVRVAREMAKGNEYAACGTFAVGNPDITKPEICKALFDGYADWWNNGYAQTGVHPVWDQHEYSPNENHIYDWWEGDVQMALPAVTGANAFTTAPKREIITEIVGRNDTPVTRLVTGTPVRMMTGKTIETVMTGAATGGTRTVHVYEQDWHETRCKFLFELCGFSLNSGGVLVSSETGVDKGGVGGFIGCGVNQAGIAKWISRYREIWQRKARDWYGNNLPMPKSGSTIFQGQDRENGKGHWGSYYVEWTNELTAAVNA